MWRGAGVHLHCLATALMAADLLSTTMTNTHSLSRSKPSREEHRPPHSIRVAVRLRFFHVYTELVFLVTSHVSIAHEI